MYNIGQVTRKFLLLVKFIAGIQSLESILVILFQYSIIKIIMDAVPTTFAQSDLWKCLLQKINTCCKGQLFVAKNNCLLHKQMIVANSNCLSQLFFCCKLKLQLFVFCKLKLQKRDNC